MIEDDCATVSAVDRLMAHARNGRADDVDVRALASILIGRCACPEVPYRRGLGLDPLEVAVLVRHYFPGLNGRWDGVCLRRHGQLNCPGAAADVHRHGRFSTSLMEQEEQDLCRLFLNHAGCGDLWPVVFARLIARACMEPEHLWMSLGLENRGQLTAILIRHFPTLAARNDGDMRWKKFFYKLLCDIEKISTCTASSCEICPHHLECYGPED